MLRSMHVILVAAVLLSVRAAVGQGLYWEVQTTGVSDKPQTARAYAVPKKMKVISEDGKVMLLRGDQEKFYLIDPSKRVYHEFTLAQLEQGAKATRSQQDAALEQMRKQLPNLPAEERAQLEKQLEKMGGAEQSVHVAVKSTGETKKILGRTCTKSVATSGSETILVAWTTKDIKGLDALREDWLNYQKRFASLGRAPGGLADAYGKLDGFPMETQVGSVKNEVVKIEPRKIPSSEFDVPTGYTNEVLPMPGQK